MEFNKTEFENLMDEAVQHHNRGEYDFALALSTEAYLMTPDDSFEKGRAARDNGARCDRLGRLNDAEVWTHEAYFVHNDLVRSMERPTREAYREFSVSAMYVGVVGLRQAISAKRNGQEYNDLGWAVLAMRQTLSNVEKAKNLASGINKKFDQYEINASRRVSLGESVIGSRKTGRALGAKAVRLALMSESPKLDTTNHDLDRSKRARAKLKALAGGVAALGVSILMPSKPGLREQLALTLADKAL